MSKIYASANSSISELQFKIQKKLPNVRTQSATYVDLGDGSSAFVTYDDNAEQFLLIVDGEIEFAAGSADEIIDEIQSSWA